MGFHNHSILMNMSKIIPDRNKMLSRVVDQNTKKKSHEGVPCSRLAMVCCRYICDQGNRNNDTFGENLSKIRVKQLRKM